MVDSPLVRRALWVVTAACLSGGLVAIPVVGEADDGASSRASRTSPGATAPTDTDGMPSPPAGAGTGADPAGAAGAAGTGLGVPLSPGSPLAQPKAEAPAEELGPAGDPGPTVPPRAGTYRYRLRQGGQETTSLTQVEDKGRSGAETNQVITRRGGGLDTTSDLSWRPDGAYVRRTVFTLAGGSRTCDWEPDVLRTRLPLAVGVSWETRSSCSLEGIGPSPVVLSYQATGRVSGVQRVRVAGQVVDVWALEETERFDFGGRTVDNTSTTLASPRHGVIVKSTTRTRDSGAGGTGDSAYELDLVNLDPE